MKRRHILIALWLALQGMQASGAAPPDAAPPSKSFFGSVLKAILEPFYALRDGKEPLADPEYREAMRKQWRLSTEAKYAWLVRKLKLSPEVRDRLYDLLVGHMFETLNGPNQPVSSAEYLALRRRQDREVAELIGEPGLAQLREYDETFEYRNEVANLQAGFAAGTGVLREDQADAMIGILRDANREFTRARPTGADYTNVTADEWQRLQSRTLLLIQQRDQRIRDRAAAVLTPAQYASLDARIRRERGHDELLCIAEQIVPLGKSGVTRQAPGAPGYFLVGVNDDMLVKDGEYRSAWKQQAHREVEATYVDVPQVLKLSPQLADQLFSLLVGQQLARLENPPARTARGANDRLRQEERELTALLGERGSTQFFEFREGFGYRFRVKQLQVDIGAGPNALLQDQVEALVAVWRDADQAMWRTALSSSTDLRARRDARILSSSAAFLSPPQLEALDAWLGRDPG